MHREIQIKQFPIVTTHWWPKTRNERFVWENEQYLFISFFTSCTQPCPSDLSAHTHPVCDVCVRALWLTLHSHGASASMLDGGHVWSVVLTRRHSYNTQSHTSLVLHERDWVFAWGDPLALEKLRQHHASDTPSVKRWRRRPVWMQREPERAHTHVTHRMRERTQITWTWLCTRGKKRYKYCSFSHTNRSFRVLGHECVVTMGNCLIWISLCMFFFPLIETVTYTCHYMTDRLERFDLKTSKLDLLKKKRHLHLGCPWGKLIDTKF